MKLDQTHHWVRTAFSNKYTINGVSTYSLWNRRLARYYPSENRRINALSMHELIRHHFNAIVNNLPHLELSTPAVKIQWVDLKRQILDPTGDLNLQVVFKVDDGRLPMTGILTQVETNFLENSDSRIPKISSLTDNQLNRILISNWYYPMKARVSRPIELTQPGNADGQRPRCPSFMEYLYPGYQRKSKMSFIEILNDL